MKKIRKIILAIISIFVLAFSQTSFIKFEKNETVEVNANPYWGTHYHFIMVQWIDGNPWAVYSDGFGLFFWPIEEYETEIITPATCESEGLVRYSVTYDDREFTHDEKIPALGHDYKFSNFAWCGYTSAIAIYTCSHDASHTLEYEANITSEKISDPTCGEEGIIRYTATYGEYSDVKDEIIPKSEHDYVFDSIVWDGFEAKAHYICANDSTHTIDYTATIESEITTPATCETTGIRTYTATYDSHISTKEEVIPATNHNYVFDSFVWDGFEAKAHYICANDASHTIDYTATIESEVTTPATCEATGIRTYTATYDSHISTKEEVIPAINHNYVFDSFVWDGFEAKAHYICANDASHTIDYDATIESEITTPATCEATGIRTYTATYETNFATKDEVIPAINHNYVFDSFVWDGFEAKAHYICANDSTHSIDYTATIESEITTPATCETSGIRTYTATYDSHIATKEEVIPAINHDYVFDSFVWDGFEAKAHYICANDATHTIDYTATIESEITTPATCEATGIRTYTATYETNFATKDEVIPAINHNYIFDSFIWDGYTAKAHYICVNDISHTVDYTATIESEITTPATCEATGIRTYTATYDSHIATKAEVIPAINHNYIFDSFIWDGYSAKAHYICANDASHTIDYTATIESEITISATCEATGIRTYTATYETNTDTKDEVIPALNHNYIFDSFIWDGYSAKAHYICANDASHTVDYTATVESEITISATCEATGIRTYTATYETNSATKNEIIPAINHNYVFDSFIWNGYEAKAHYICANDASHTIDYDAEVTFEVTLEPTWDDDGIRTYTATYGTNTTTKDEVIPATSNNYQFDSFIWDGYTAKAHYVSTIDPTKSVDFDASVQSVVVTYATCEDSGLKVYTASYESYSDTKNEILSALNHNYIFDSFIWDGYSAKAHYICANDASHTVDYTATVESEITTPATCEASGIRTYTASYETNNTTKDEVIPALNHNYIFDSFIWDGYSAKAHYICANDASHTVDYVATITSEITIPATCESSGIRTYTASYETNSASKNEVIPALNHNYIFDSFIWDGYSAKAHYICANDASHTVDYVATITSEITTPATCEATGIRTYTASYETNSATKDEVIPAINHNYIFDSFIWDGYSAKAHYICANDASHNVDYVATITSEITTPATCEASGIRTYTASYETNNTTKDEVIPAINHNYIFDSFIWDGYSAKAHYICANDASHTVDYVATITSEITTPATCEASGIRTYTASYETNSTTKDEVIPAINHNYVFDSFIWDGYSAKAHYICANDNSHTIDYTATVVSEITIPATCESTGLRTYNASYSGNKASKNEIIPAINHNYVFDSFIWNGYSAKAHYICANDNSHTIDYDADVVNEVSKSPTCESSGVRRYSASYDSHVDYKEEEIPAINHNYVFDSFIWDGYSAKAHYICANDASHTIDYTATVVSEITIPATCESTGLRTYNASYSGNKASKNEIIPAINHNYVFDSIIWDGYTAKARYICANDSTHTIDYTATVVSEITTPATCTTNGIRTYTASYDTHQASKNEVILAIKHNYVFDSIIFEGYSAKVHFICANDASHTIDYDASVTSKITTNATCEQTGVKTYTATYGIHSATKDEVIPATNHDYQFDHISWNGYEAIAIYVCSHDESHKCQYDARVTIKLSKEATCESSGIYTYTATYDIYSVSKDDIIPAKNHNYVFSEFVWNGYEAKAHYICANDASHTIDYDASISYEETISPTDKTEGLRTYTATYKDYSDTKTEVIPANKSNYEFDSIIWNGFEAKAHYVSSTDKSKSIDYDCSISESIINNPTCETTGLKTYTANYDGHSSSKNEVLAIVEHDYVFNSFEFNGASAKAIYVCSYNENHKIEYEADVTTEILKKASCSEEGSIKYSASYEGESTTKIDVIPKSNHNYVFDSFIWDGSEAKAHYICENNETHTIDYDAIVSITPISAAGCGSSGLAKYVAKYDIYETSKIEVVDALEHSYGTWIDEIPATCENDGVLGHYHCENCNKNFDINKEELVSLKINAIEHNYEFDSFAWDGFEAKAIYVCTHDASHIKEYDATIKVSVTKEATCEASGIRTYSALHGVNKDTKEEIIPAINHNYVFVSFIWDGFEAKAHYVCSNDVNHYVDYDASVSSSISKDPTCETSGIRTYSATYDIYVDSKDEVIPALNHNYEFSKFVWDGYEAKAIYVCSNNPTHEVSYDAVVINEITKANDCNNDGIRTYIAMYENYTDTKEVVIDAKGHTYGEFEVSKEATCKNEGVEIAKCIDCESTISRSIPVSDSHVYGDEIFVIKEPTLTEKGIYQVSCTICGKKYQYEVEAKVASDEKEDIKVIYNDNNIDDETKITIEKIDEQSDAYNDTKAALDDLKDNQFTLLSINAIKGGVKVQPNGTVQLSISIPEGYSNHLSLGFINDSGEFETVEAYIVDGAIIASIDEFREFVLVDLDNKISGDEGCTNPNVLFFIILGILILLFIFLFIIILIKKEKEDDEENESIKPNTL